MIFSGTMIKDILRDYSEAYIFNVLTMFGIDIVILLFILGTAYYIDLNKNDVYFKKFVPFLKATCFLVVLFVVCINAGIFLKL